MLNNLTKLGFGSVGILGTELVQNIAAANPDDITAMGNIIIQIIIAIASIIGIFKRKKN